MAILLNQSQLRFGNDDGSETTQTFKAAVNTNITFGSSDLDVNFLFRVESTDISGIGAVLTAQLNYSKNGGAYTNVNASSSVVRSSNSPNITDNTATTKRLGGVSTFVAGNFDSVDGLCSSVTLGANNETENLFCVQVRSVDVINGDTIDFRLTNGTGAYGSYTFTGRITINTTIPNSGFLRFI